MGGQRVANGREHKFRPRATYESTDLHCNCNERGLTGMAQETRSFQAEVKQLLHLMIHSLYSNKEIFLRELVSNASDAADKLRFEAISDNALYESDPELRIRITVDPAARTLTVADNGIGMSREEVVRN